MSQEPTVGDFLRAMSERIYPEDDPERLFVEWMIGNMRDLRGAAEALGVVIEEGPDFAKRLRAAVLPVLLERREQRDG